MKMLITGIVTGFILAVLFFIPVLFQQRHSQFVNGNHQGEIDGQIEVWKSLNKHFSHSIPSSYKIMAYIPIKDMAINVVEKNGVLTIETR